MRKAPRTPEAAPPSRAPQRPAADGAEDLASCFAGLAVASQRGGSTAGQLAAAAALPLPNAGSHQPESSVGRSSGGSVLPGSGSGPDEAVDLTGEEQPESPQPTAPQARGGAWLSPLQPLLRGLRRLTGSPAIATRTELPASGADLQGIAHCISIVHDHAGVHARVLVQAHTHLGACLRGHAGGEGEGASLSFCLIYISIRACCKDVILCINEMSKPQWIRGQLGRELGQMGERLCADSISGPTEDDALQAPPSSRPASRRATVAPRTPWQSGATPQQRQPLDQIPQRQRSPNSTTPTISSTTASCTGTLPAMQKATRLTQVIWRLVCHPTTAQTLVLIPSLRRAFLLPTATIL